MNSVHGWTPISQFTQVDSQEIDTDHTYMWPASGQLRDNAWLRVLRFRHCLRDKLAMLWQKLPDEDGIGDDVVLDVNGFVITSETGSGLPLRRSGQGMPLPGLMLRAYNSPQFPLSSLES